MIRPFTVLCALLAGASGLYLYNEKHRTTVLDQQISHIVAETETVQQQTSMLRTQWALLNQPDRLGQLATRFLPSLHPMAPQQFIRMASLESHLPAPGSAPAIDTTREAIGAAVAAAHGQQFKPSDAQPDAPAPNDRTPDTHAPAAALAAVVDKPAAIVHPTAPVVLAAATRIVRPAHDAPAHPITLADATPTPPRMPDSVAVAHHAPVVASISPLETHISHAARPVAVSVPQVTAYHPANPAPITVAAWRPAPAPRRYADARFSGAASSLGYAAGGGLPPPVPLSN